MQWWVWGAALAGTGAPNILVVLLDDVGVDKVGAYGAGADPPPTPVMDGLADQGVLFRRAYSAPVCSPTRGALLTGRYGRRYGLGQIVNMNQDYQLPLSEWTLPEMVRQSPLGTYETAALGKWHLSAWEATASRLHPNLSGFDWFSGTFANPIQNEEAARTDYFRWEKTTNGAVQTAENYATTDTIDDAIHRIEAMEPPWLIFVPLSASHAPWHVPPEALFTRALGSDPSAADLYDAALEAADTEIGRLLDHVDLTSTFIVVVGDNGTPSEAVRPGVSPEQAKGTLYEGGVHVPLIITGPTVAEPGTETDVLAHVVDLLPTLAEVVSVRPALFAELDGISLVPWLEDPDAPPRRQYMYTERMKPNGPGPYSVDDRMLRDDDYKLIRHADAADELFDLRGRQDDGPDLLRGSLTAEQEAAYVRLSLALDDQVDRITPPQGCGCRQTPGPGAWFLLVPLIGLGLRGRRTARRDTAP